MGKQRDEGSESVTQQVQSRDIDVKKSDKFSSEYNLSLLFYSNVSKIFSNVMSYTLEY